MSKKNNHIEKQCSQKQTVETSQKGHTEEMMDSVESSNSTADSADVSLTLQQRIDELEQQVKELEDLKLRQMAEFDNYRRRTNKEKLDLMETAGERIFIDMLPLVDDFERALNSLQKHTLQTEGIEYAQALTEGVELIYQKFINFLNQHEVHAILTDNVAFNTDEHEAITTFAAGEEKKGQIIDCTQKGYKLGEKVIRFAKVVVGE